MARSVFLIVRVPHLGLVGQTETGLGQEELHFAELEKLKKLVNSERSHDALSIEPSIIEGPSWSPPPPVKQSKRPVRRRPPLFHTRKPRLT